jgi:glyoxylase-like metal-dependent hydrolase (beta-lactamase superfamily II)
VEYVFLTHVHLDHAGGAGLLMQALPNAVAVLHPRGAPHLIEPGKLIAGSKVVYGEERFHALYGQIAPLPPERVRVAGDQEQYRLGGRELTLLHTPGHALHHYVIVDRAHACVFSGDTFGLSYREFDTADGAFIIPTTTPTQFDPEQLIASIDRILSFQPESIYLMHFSRVTGIPLLGESLKAQIRELVTIAKRHAGAANPHAAIKADMRRSLLTRLLQHGCTLPEAEIDTRLAGDLELNTQGLVVWLDRVAR